MVIVATITITSESPEETKILIMSLTSESKEKTKSCKHRESASALSRLQEPLKIQKNRQVGCCEWDSFLHWQYFSNWFQIKRIVKWGDESVKKYKKKLHWFSPPNMLNTRLASGQYAACGFQIYLQRKHQPMIYQVLSCQHHPAHHYHQWQPHHNQHDQDHHQIYIPCCLFVMVSWISFIIDPKVQPISIDPMTNSLIINFLTSSLLLTGYTRSDVSLGYFVPGHHQCFQQRPLPGSSILIILLIISKCQHLWVNISKWNIALLLNPFWLPCW